MTEEQQWQDGEDDEDYGSDCSCGGEDVDCELAYLHTKTWCENCKEGQYARCMGQGCTCMFAREAKEEAENGMCLDCIEERHFTCGNGCTCECSWRTAEFGLCCWSCKHCPCHEGRFAACACARVKFLDGDPIGEEAGEDSRWVASAVGSNWPWGGTAEDLDHGEDSPEFGSAQEDLDEWEDNLASATERLGRPCWTRNVLRENERVLRIKRKNELGDAYEAGWQMMERWALEEELDDREDETANDRYGGWAGPGPLRREGLFDAGSRVGKLWRDAWEDQELRRWKPAPGATRQRPTKRMD